MLPTHKPARWFRLLTVLVIVSAISATSAFAGDWPGLKVRGQNIVDSSGKNVVLKGFGIGEWTNTEAYMLEWPDRNGKYLWYYGYTRIHSTLETLMGENAADQYWRTWNANVITEADVAKWQSWGVNAIRFSINYHWISPADGVYLDSGWQWIDQMIAWCKAHHIYVILCMHAAQLVHRWPPLRRRLRRAFGPRLFDLICRMVGLLRRDRTQVRLVAHKQKLNESILN